MNRKPSPAGLAVLAVLIVLIGWYSRGPVAAQEAAPRRPQKWEYKIVLPTSQADPLLNQPQLDKLGTEGWELCAAHSSTLPHYFIFKRAGESRVRRLPPVP